jgi:hypothetical protein
MIAITAADPEPLSAVLGALAAWAGFGVIGIVLILVILWLANQRK